MLRYSGDGTPRGQDRRGVTAYSSSSKAGSADDGEACSACCGKTLNRLFSRCQPNVQPLQPTLPEVGVSSPAAELKSRPRHTMSQMPVDELARSVGGGLLRPLIAAARQRAITITFGSAESREMRRLVERSVADVLAEHSKIRDISAELDVLHDDAVADELLRASVPNTPRNWDSARARWRELYETQAPSIFIAFLEDLADALKARLQGSVLLGTLWVALTAEGVSRQVAHNTRQLDAIMERIGASPPPIDDTGAVPDPLAGIVHQRDRIATDLPYAISIANALGDALAAGTAIRNVDLRIRGDGGIEVEPHSEADVQVKITKTVPNTEDGKLALEELNEALRTEREVDLGDVDIEVTVDGLPIASGPEHGRVVMHRVTERMRFLIDTVIPSVDSLRLFAEGDAYRAQDELHFSSTATNYEPIHVDLKLDAAGHVTARFFVPEDAPFSLEQQLVLQRILRFMGIGGTISIDFLSPAYRRGAAEVPGDQGLADAVSAVEPMALLVELQRRLGLDLPAISGISGGDYALSAWAMRLLEDGEVAGTASGTIRMTGTSELAEQLTKNTTADGRVALRYDVKALPITLSSGVEVDLGPVQHVIPKGRIEGPRQMLSGEYEAIVRYEADDEQYFRRPEVDTDA
jgi:hypothetical protein